MPPLPCPWCGPRAMTAPFTFKRIAGWITECGSCGAQQHLGKPTKGEAIEAWNRRALPADAQDAPRHIWTREEAAALDYGVLTDLLNGRGPVERKTYSSMLEYRAAFFPTSVREHWLFSTNCDHGAGTNRAQCACGEFLGPVRTSQGEAVSDYWGHLGAVMADTVLKAAAALPLRPASEGAPAHVWTREEAAALDYGVLTDLLNGLARPAPAPQQAAAEPAIADEYATVENAVAALDKLWKYTEGLTLGDHGPEQSSDGWYAFEQAEQTIRKMLKAAASPVPPDTEARRD